jgi:hypothetical protein
MPKICLCEGCRNVVWGKGYCRWHQSFRQDKKPVKKKNVKPIRPRSKKREAEYAIYRTVREEFLSRPENKYCRKYPHLLATTVHHSKGKIGKLLYDTKWFVALSMEGHRWTEEHPEEAKKLKLSFDRLSNT